MSIPPEFSSVRAIITCPPSTAFPPGSDPSGDQSRKRAQANMPCGLQSGKRDRCFFATFVPARVRRRGAITL
jgi:hypothetical protein